MRRDGYADFFSVQLEANWIDTGFGTRNQFAKGKSVCQEVGFAFSLHSANQGCLLLFQARV